MQQYTSEHTAEIRATTEGQEWDDTTLSLSHDPFEEIDRLTMISTVVFEATGTDTTIELQNESASSAEAGFRFELDVSYPVGQPDSLTGHSSSFANIPDWESETVDLSEYADSYMDQDVDSYVEFIGDLTVDARAYQSLSDSSGELWINDDLNDEHVCDLEILVIGRAP